MSSTTLRPPAASVYVGLSTSTLAKMRLRGDGPTYIKLGPRAVGYRVDDLDAWLDGLRRKSTSDPRGDKLPASAHQAEAPDAA